MPAERLVLAEDNALLRAGLTQLLEGSGFVVARAVDNAVELDDALLDPEVDGAVLDVRMPPTFTDEGLRAAIVVRAQRPGFPGPRSAGGMGGPLRGPPSH